MLFLEDSYLKDFNAKILSFESNQIILDKTAFYAKSGGQPGDIGTLSINNKIFDVVDTIKDNQNQILHIIRNDTNIKNGDQVKGIINWNKRYKYMRMHTALHILCSVIPYGVTGGQINYDKSRLDFDLKDEKINKEEIENKINKLIQENHKISYQWITNKELEIKPELVRTMSVKPPKTMEKIRLVKIGDIDLQPCGGTHLKNTIEIGKVNILKIENKGKRNRRIIISLD
tara:strand:- start:1379 stop:2068 length:690 start_codon:yes stop_codon:yes gene_type:complete